MLISKLHLGLAAGVLLAISTGLVVVFHEHAQLRQEAAAHAVATATNVAHLKAQLATQTQRAVKAEAEVATLLQAVKARAATAAATTALSRPPIDVEELLKAATMRASELITDGKLQEALDEYVKCYRELQAKRPGSSECQRLMGLIQYMGRTYPPALVALAGLRDAAMAQRQADPGKRELVFEIGLLNERLDQGRRTLVLYDSLPANDSARQSLPMIANKSFIEAGRYTDALLGKPFGSMMNSLEAGLGRVASQPGEYPESVRTSLINDALVNIEVLTGAGRGEEARMLTDKLLSYDGSEPIRAAIKDHVDRANRRAVR